jgi:hypothetical protein
MTAENSRHLRLSSSKRQGGARPLKPERSMSEKISPRSPSISAAASQLVVVPVSTLWRS